MDGVEPGCRFCLDNGLLDDQPILRNGSCYFLGSLDPVLRHAGMIVPFRHCAEPFELTRGEWLDTLAMMGEARAYLAAAGPDGFTLGWNVGVVAGQTVGHVHLHIIARFADEPLAGVGIRNHLRQPANRRPGA